MRKDIDGDSKKNLIWLLFSWRSEGTIFVQFISDTEQELIIISYRNSFLLFSFRQ